MNIAVLISIRPKWCGEIIPGKKKIDVRKTRPNLLTPFKCYIYCTNPRHYVDSRHWFSYPAEPLWITANKDVKSNQERGDGDCILLNGKVIGEFVCDYIKCIPPEMFVVKEDAESVLQGSCLTPKEAKEYAGWKPGAYLSECKDLYGWQISDLVIYDTPKELSEFKGVCKHMDRDCCACPFFDYNAMDCMSRKITRPPQSWCYVEELT